MKRIYILWIMLGMMNVGITSCSNWLDVTPKLDIYEETLFKDANGYYIALNGLYVKLSEAPLYGKELSWGAMEAWGKMYQFNLPENQTYYDLSQFDYLQKGPKSIGADIWLNCYGVIAEANNLIQNLENDTKTLFNDHEATRNVILGEAYAIRAMMHFEIVRIFAQAPIADQGGITAYVPFVDKFPSKINNPLPTKEMLLRITQDLEKAKVLIKPYDLEHAGKDSYATNNVNLRLMFNFGEGYNESMNQNDGFSGFRANRLSYYPLLQLMARVYLYAGNNDKAFENANEIVQLVEQGSVYSFVPPANIGNPMSLDIVQPRLHQEILFGAYNSKMKDLVKSYFRPQESNGLLNFRIRDKVSIFIENGADVRLAAIPQDICTKYTSESKDPEQAIRAQSLIPVMRFPECYYIAAESIFDKNPEEAVKIFNKVVNARNNSVYQLSSGVAKSKFMEEIVKEYRREFICEGVSVFVYKRLNLDIPLSGGFIPAKGMLVLPLPDTESGIY